MKLRYRYLTVYTQEGACVCVCVRERQQQQQQQRQHEALSLWQAAPTAARPQQQHSAVLANKCRRARPKHAGACCAGVHCSQHPAPPRSGSSSPSGRCGGLLLLSGDSGSSSGGGSSAADTCVSSERAHRLAAASWVGAQSATGTAPLGQATGQHRVRCHTHPTHTHTHNLTPVLTSEMGA
jgi:hypothetical protein